MFIIALHHSSNNNNVVYGNPIAKQMAPYNMTDPCIKDCYGQCVPNNKCFYLPAGFVCKFYGRKCQMVCDENYCAPPNKCQGCNDMVIELAYKYKTKLLPIPPWTCKNHPMPATISSDSKMDKDSKYPKMDAVKNPKRVL